MPRILAIDTSTNACSAALLSAGQITARRHEPMSRGHAERLVPMIAEVTEEAGVKARELDLVAITVGPGAFTGIRIGLAAARGLALAAEVPCLGVTTTETVAAAAGSHPCLVTALDSKRDDLYVQIFDAVGQPAADPVAVSPAELDDLLGRHGGPEAVISLAGDGAARARDILQPLGRTCRVIGVEFPDAADLARIAAARWRPGDWPDPPVPLYLRPPDAVVPINGGRIRP